jgi:hypothetical protein
MILSGKFISAPLPFMRSIPTWRASLADFLHDRSDPISKESSAAGSGMTNTMGFDVQFFQLRGSDVAKRDDFLAWKEIEESFEHR